MINIAEGASKFVPPFPVVFYGVIAMVLFVILGLVTWSYRDVANRHEHKTSNSKGRH